MKAVETIPVTDKVAPSTWSTARAGSSKIVPAHLEKLAVVYVRQSSPKQVLENRESRERQYAFADRAVAFGWPRERVLTIDEDLGKSGRPSKAATAFSVSPPR